MFIYLVVYTTSGEIGSWYNRSEAVGFELISRESHEL